MFVLIQTDIAFHQVISSVFSSAVGVRRPLDGAGGPCLAEQPNAVDILDQAKVPMTRLLWLLTVFTFLLCKVAHSLLPLTRA